MCLINFKGFIKIFYYSFYVIKFNIILKDFDLIHRAKEICVRIKIDLMKLFILYLSFENTYIYVSIFFSVTGKQMCSFF